MEKKLSSIDYLIEQLEGENNRIAMVVGIKKYNSIIQQAKAMHKDEVQDAYRISPNNELWSNSGIDYYNETFGG